MSDENNHPQYGDGINDLSREGGQEGGNPQREIVQFVPKGDFVAIGSSGVVELGHHGHAIKSPWPDRLYDIACQEIAMEADIYRILGHHERLVDIIDWDPLQFTLTMQYMANGTLKDHLKLHNETISPPQRLRWACQCAQGLAYVHSHGIWHCDFKPKNILLDANWDVKVIDFSGASIHGSTPMGYPGDRFSPSGPTPAGDILFGLRQDLFALGSTIFTIMAGNEPYGGIDSQEVRRLFDQQHFPDVSQMSCGMVVRQCWSGELRSVQCVTTALQQLYEHQFGADDAH